MKPVCRLLLVEDDHQEAQSIERRCCPDPTTAAIDVVANVADAETAVRGREYDLIICDLALPSDSRQLDPEVGEGLRLFSLIREQSQGTPVVVLSGHLDVHIVQGFLAASRSGDLYGRRTEEPLVQAFAKEDLPDCIEAVQTHIARITALDSLELEFPTGLTLSVSDGRAIKIYGRRTGASRAIVEPLDGGLSDSKTLKVSYSDIGGTSTGVVVVKLGDLRRVISEAEKYERLAAKLPVGLGAHVLYVVQAGAARRGALIYQLADEYTRSLFGLIADRDPAAVAATERLSRRLEGWVANAPVIVRALADLRRPQISDEELRESGTDIPNERDIEVSVRQTLAHGDLHGLNVLVNQLNEPTLIDYGEVINANAALDPVTLELSVVYHPAMAGKLGAWPDEAQAANWEDIDRYCVGCPTEEFIRVCRTWAGNVAAGQDEILASAYAYSIRQAKYRGPAATLAAVVARGTFEALARS